MLRTPLKSLEAERATPLPKTGTFAVVSRESASSVWTFETWAASESVALSAAAFYARFEYTRGELGYEAKVISERDADAKRYDANGVVFTALPKGLKKVMPTREPHPVQLACGLRADGTPAPDIPPMRTPVKKLLPTRERK